MNVSMSLSNRSFLFVLTLVIVFRLFFALGALTAIALIDGNIGMEMGSMLDGAMVNHMMGRDGQVTNEMMARAPQYKLSRERDRFLIADARYKT